MADLDEMNRNLRAQQRHPERATLTVEQLAQMLGVGRNTIYEMIHTNELPIPPIRFGRRILFSRAKVEEFLGRDPEQTGGPLREAQQEAERYRDALEHIIDQCRRVLNDPQNRGRCGPSNRANPRRFPTNCFRGNRSEGRSKEPCRLLRTQTIAQSD